jgi:hypothetical protein
MGGKRHPQAKGAVEIIDEAVHRLRRFSADLLPVYYLGTLPFVLAFLYFWSDMSRSAYARESCAPAALGLSVLYVWMKYCHAVFSGRIKEGAHPEAYRRGPLGRIARRSATQALVHASGLFVLPLSLIAVIPFPWVYAFYQSASAQPGSTAPSLTRLCKGSWQEATRWPGQNHRLILILAFFSFFVFLNISLCLVLLPYLVKALFGFESVFTRSGTSVLNTTFLATAAGITYLCISPLVKTVYALRCFYGSSITSGNDLAMGLRPYRRGILPLAACILFFGLVPPAATAAAEKGPVPRQAAPLSPKELDRSIREVMNRLEFVWRLPREYRLKEATPPSGPLSSLLKWTGKAVQGLGNAVGQWISKALLWLRGLSPKGKPVEKDPSKSGWTQSVRDLLVVLLILVGGLFGVLLLRTWRHGRRIEAGSGGDEAPSPTHGAVEYVNPGDLPVEGWVAAAAEYRDKGAFRLALRALYLATLAHLAEQDMIALARYKSNRDYERELKRRSLQGDLVDAFSQNVALFDRAWYGLHSVTQRDLDLFIANQKGILAHA